MSARTKYKDSSLMRKIILVAALTLLGCVWAADEPTKDTPKISDPALSAYEKAIADIDAKALIEKRKARDVAVKALDKRLQELSKAGKLDSAIALKGERDKLAELWKGSDGDLLGDDGSLNIISAKYGLQNGPSIDATAYMKKQVKNGQLVYVNGDEIWREIGDPAPGAEKVLEITYVFKGKKETKRLFKHQSVELK
jgi:hypothetical protein